MPIKCQNCGHTVGYGDEVPANPAHCGQCPPWKCEDCGLTDSADDHCTCWISVDGLPLADIKAVMAAADLSVG